MRSNFRSPDIWLSTPLLYSTIRSVKVYFISWKLSVQPRSHARSGPNSKSYCLIYQGYKKLMFCFTQFNCKNTSHISTLMPEWYSFSFHYFWPVLTLLACINLVPRVYSAFKMSAGNEVDLVLTFRQTSYNSNSVLITIHTILIILTTLSVSFILWLPFFSFIRILSNFIVTTQLPSKLRLFWGIRRQKFWYWCRTWFSSEDSRQVEHRKFILKETKVNCTEMMIPSLVIWQREKMSFIFIQTAA